MKRLIVCCDGTWNNASQEENGIPAPTNVFKIHNALADDDSGTPQLKYYHPGVGGEQIGIMAAILGGAIGAGIDRHICSAYQWLASEYAEGDEIYLYGFSRGAYTVRSLAGFLRRGLLDVRGLPSNESWNRVHHAYDKGYRTKDSQRKDWAGDWAFFHKGEAAPIHFLGVWDTVGALGVPDDFEILNILDRPSQWRFHDTELGPNIRTGRHAMAMDEIRSSFTVARWSDRHTHRDAKELWFPGVHCDVGGGYADSSLSDGALRWMIDESKTVGLKFRQVADSVEGDPLGPMHNSYKGAFASMRSRPRNIPAVSETNSGRFHPSALLRQKVSPLSYPAYHPTTMLQPGESRTVDIYADTRWNNTGIYLQAGSSYRFQGIGEWQDGSDTCDWKGIQKARFTTGHVARGVSSSLGALENRFKKSTHNVSADFPFTRRIESTPWLAMVGAIANDGLEGSIPVGGDGSPMPHQYLNLQHFQERPVSVTKSGYLHCFANDVWTRYHDNHGSIKLTVTRV